VAEGLGLKEMPQAVEPARRVINDLPPSQALSIVQNGPRSFKGRKMGVLASDGADASLIEALETALAEQGATLEIIAPNVGGITLSDGSSRSPKQRVNGGPSVLYDAVTILLSPDGAQMLVNEAAAKNFVSDAFAHAKFIAFSADARPLLNKAGMTPDGGCLALNGPGDI
jgi:catalase